MFQNVTLTFDIFTIRVLKCWSLKPGVNVCIIVKRRFFSEKKSFSNRGVNSVKTKIAFDSDREYYLINAFTGG